MQDYLLCKTIYFARLSIYFYKTIYFARLSTFTRLSTLQDFLLCITIYIFCKTIYFARLSTLHYCLLCKTIYFARLSTSQFNDFHYFFHIHPMKMKMKMINKVNTMTTDLRSRGQKVNHVSPVIEKFFVMKLILV